MQYFVEHFIEHTFALTSRGPQRAEIQVFEKTSHFGKQLVQLIQGFENILNFDRLI